VAGRRRRNDGPTKPLVRAVRPERRAQNVNARLAAALDPRDRVSIAAGYLRSALTVHPHAGVAEQQVVALIAAADGLYREAETR
jgi:hypothetical protein